MYYRNGPRYGYGYGYPYGCGYGYGYPYRYGYGYANLYTPYSPLPYMLSSDTLPYYLSQTNLSQSLPPPPPTPLQVAYATNYSY